VGAGAVVAVIRSRERDVRRAFHRAGALDPAGAMSLEEIGLEKSMALRRLMRRDVIRESSPGCYHFDEDVWQSVRAMRIRMALMILAAVVLTALVGVYGVYATR